ncbi:MAG: 4Fe-4S dicluster domain-containing protein [Desulfohalobiaceae bacterium]
MQPLRLDSLYDAQFVQEVKKESSQDPALCYQCGNCTAGCPYTFVYDLPVHQIMRLLQAGQKEKILSSRSLWLCASCQSCTTRCPNNIDVAQVMDVLRHMARRQGYLTEKKVVSFQDSFLKSMQKHGRVFELGIMLGFIRRTGKFWTDMELGPKLALKGKLSPKPHEIQGKQEVAKIYDKFMGGQN